MKRILFLLISILLIAVPVHAERPRGTGYIIEHTSRGIEGQVSTIVGNGAQGQSSQQLDHPNKLQIDSKGHIYFLDGSTTTVKLRKYDGRKISTVLDIAKAKVQRNVHFWSSGLAIINDQVYLGGLDTIYLVKDGRMNEYDIGIREYMKKNKIEQIYRIRKQGDTLYILFRTRWGRGDTNDYILAEYNPKTKKMTTLLPKFDELLVYNFYVNKKDDGVYLATKFGYVTFISFKTLESTITVKMDDRRSVVSDIWYDKGNNAMYATQHYFDAYIHRNPRGVGEGLEPYQLAGSIRGYVDGVDDEVRMDFPMDFVWDGSGYLFADVGNHAIRKIWTNKAPMEKL